MHEIREQLELLSPINDKDWKLFSEKLIKCAVSKKTSILKQGYVEDYIYFIKDGILRQYIPLEEKEITLGFGFSNTFMSGYDSFITRTPSNFTIESLTTAVLYKIHYNDLHFIYQNTSSGNEIGRRIAENLFLLKTKREYSFLQETPEKRYVNLFKDRPNVIAQIPLKYIASYIGVTPQALSRIRKRIN